ncbi:hypothetical protein FAVG1_04750 [Fusarium avenaceum]|nr:hypothetical protein FAVG1_04750 [Fusarium avenaceum]
MEASPESDRPRKRVKYDHDHNATHMNTTIPNTNTVDNSYKSIIDDLSYYPTPLSPIRDSMSPSRLITDDPNTGDMSWTLDLSAPQSVPFLHITPPPQQQYPPPNHQALEPRRLSPSCPVTSLPSIVEYHGSHGQEFVVSPFTIAGDRLIMSAVPSFTRPHNGQVNGYIKFHWPSRTPSRRHSDSVPSSSENKMELATQSGRLIHPSRKMSVPRTILPTETAIASNMSMDTTWTAKPSFERSPVSSNNLLFQMTNTGEPRMLPPQFGSQAKMDHVSRRLFEFYIKNWCPGRSLLDKTNLWLKDLAPMCENYGISCAIESLAGIYVYDYSPSELVRVRVNQQYAQADKCFTKLLNSPGEAREGTEVITMAILLSMIDIILTERRRKKPYKPRWLEGFKQAENLLRQTDPGVRYWKDKNIQYDRLRISQCVMVGRAVILTQAMTPLPPPTMDPEAEASRFSWLLYGTERDVSEIHGGCGFSQKLLHIMSQISYCAARLQQEPGSTLVPITARFLDRQLSSMRQWSHDTRSETQESVERHSQTIDWVRLKLAGEVIDSSQDMTDLTAEAWRIAVIIYFQCRLLRLPRNHPDVIANLSDLTKCIRIMPTSGSHFTAQAPLLPVFLLGMLATHHDHKNVAQNWFEQVVQTPARSSVPPLYQALQRIWCWIDEEVELPHEPTIIPEHIGSRYSWWEQLVAKVTEKEEEILCLT